MHSMMAVVVVSCERVIIAKVSGEGCTFHFKFNPSLSLASWGKTKKIMKKGYKKGNRGRMQLVELDFSRVKKKKMQIYYVAAHYIAYY